MNIQNRRYDLHAASGVRGFWDDLWAGLLMVELWRTFAWDEIQQRYRRSMLGVSWIVLSFLMFVAGVSFFFSALSGRELENFIVYVALGYAAFIFISGNFIDGCQVFTSSHVWIKAMSLPYSVHVYRSLFRSFLTFSLQMAVVFPIMIWSGWTPGLITLMAIPALAIYVLNAIAAQYLLGLIAARFEDAGHLVTSITRLLIFVTPILWVREASMGPGVGGGFESLDALCRNFQGTFFGRDAKNDKLVGGSRGDLRGLVGSRNVGRHIPPSLAVLVIRSTMSHILVQDLSVTYPLFNRARSSLDTQTAPLDAAEDFGGTQRLVRDGRGYIKGVRALDGISFEVHEGERLGLVGANGSGKTTLLQVLAGIYPPERGSIVVEGQRTSLVNINLGMRSEATGNKNITLRGLASGRGRAEIEERGQKSRPSPDWVSSLISRSTPILPACACD